MIIIEVYSNGKSKFFTGKSKTTFKKIAEELLNKKYEVFLKNPDYIFHTPEMAEGHLLIKMILSTTKNISTEMFREISTIFCKGIEKWAEAEGYKFHRLDFWIITPNHTYFF